MTYHNIISKIKTILSLFSKLSMHYKLICSQFNISLIKKPYLIPMLAIIYQCILNAGMVYCDIWDWNIGKYLLNDPIEPNQLENNKQDGVVAYPQIIEKLADSLLHGENFDNENNTIDHDYELYKQDYLHLRNVMKEIQYDEVYGGLKSWVYDDISYLDSFANFKEYNGVVYTTREANLVETLSILYDNSKALKDVGIQAYLDDGSINPIIDTNTKAYVLQLINTMPHDNFISLMKDFNVIISLNLDIPTDNSKDNVLINVFYSKLEETFNDYINSQL